MSINKLQNNITTLDIISKTNDVVEKTNITSGGWVQKAYAAYTYPSTLSHSSNPTKYTVDLSNYLPNDGENYEVLLYYGGSGNLVLGTDFHDTLGGFYANDNRQCQTVVVGPKREIYLFVYNSNVTSFEFHVNAYKQVTSDINHKLEDDLSNLSNSGTTAMETLIANKAKNFGIPTSKYIDFEIGANGATYTAPANGWFNANYYVDTIGKFLHIRTLDTDFRVDDMSYNGWVSACMPVYKGEQVSIGYSTPTLSKIRFIYASNEG